MDDEARRILALASDYPLLGINAVRAQQIADECTSLRDACQAATKRFSASEEAKFAAMFASSVYGSWPQ